MALNPPNSSEMCKQESFDNFFKSWVAEHQQYLHEMVSITAKDEIQSSENERVVRNLVDKVVDHYQDYNRVKSNWSNHDVLPILSPSWTTSFEDAFLWIGGWRPTTALHLVQSKSGLQLEAKLVAVSQKLGPPDLGDLTAKQLLLLDDLQRKTIKEEKSVTEKWAKQQETVADSAMVELSHWLSGVINEGQIDQDEIDERVESALAPKERGLQEVLQKADNLRIKTLKAVIEILEPIQNLHFLIAAAELFLRNHELGQKRDAAKNGSSLDRGESSDCGAKRLRVN